jgi:tRNA(Ile)-lysidine synthase
MLVHLAKLRNAAGIMTGHHLSDSAESVLLKMVRGTGIGLSPIAQTQLRDGIPLWRPLLALSKSDLYAYCDRHQILYREDHSNADVQFSRNRIRHRVIPELQQINPKVEAELNRFSQRMATIMEGCRSLIDPSLARSRERGYWLSPQVKKAHPGVQQVMIFDALQTLEIIPSEFKIAAIMNLKTGSIQLNSKWQVSIEEDGIWIQKIELPVRTSFEYVIPLDPLPTEMALSEIAMKVRLEWVPAEADGLSFPACSTDILTIRNRRSGDRFFPTGFPKEGSLKQFLIHQKIPRALRDRLPLFFIGDQLVWVGSIRASQHARNAFGTTPRLRILLLGDL